MSASFSWVINQTVPFILNIYPFSLVCSTISLNIMSINSWALFSVPLIYFSNATLLWFCLNCYCDFWQALWLGKVYQLLFFFNSTFNILGCLFFKYIVENLSSNINKIFFKWNFYLYILESIAQFGDNWHLYSFRTSINIDCLSTWSFLTIICSFSLKSICEIIEENYSKDDMYLLTVNI